jgi:hypothetical protein
MLFFLFVYLSAGVFDHHIDQFYDHQEEKHPHQGGAYILIHTIVKSIEQQVSHVLEFALQDTFFAAKAKKRRKVPRRIWAFY